MASETMAKRTEWDIHEGLPAEVLAEYHEAAAAIEAAASLPRKQRRPASRRYEAALAAVVKANVSSGYFTREHVPGGCPDLQTEESAHRCGWDHYYRTR